MPASVRVGAIAMGVLAALLLTYAGLLWYSFDDSVQQIADAAKGITEDSARRFVLTLLIPCLLLGVLLALAAWFLPRRQAWARWIGLAASGLLAVLMLFSMVGGAGISVLPLLLFVLAAVAVRSLLLRSTGTWVPPLRARG
jgi:glucan phosphoethanolaminetransferase (alkaline phosphatase superfamily)